MSCHESLMAKRRKHKKQRQPTSSSLNKDKSLPELPGPRSDSRAEKSAFTPSSELDTPPTEKYSDPMDPSPRPPQGKLRKEKTNGTRRDESPASVDESRKGTVPGQLLFSPTDRSENLTLPASTYKRLSTNVKASGASASYDGVGGDDGLFVPLLLDTSPAMGAPPLSDKPREFAEVPIALPQAEPKPSSNKDYFQRKPAPASGRDYMREAHKDTSRASSAERKQPQSPHIAYQEKGRQPSDQAGDTLRWRKEPPSDASPAPPSRPADAGSISKESYAIASSSQSEFKLQDVPKNKKVGSRRTSGSDAKTPSDGSPAMELTSKKFSPLVDIPRSASPTDMDKPKKREEAPPLSKQTMPSNQQPRGSVERPKRGDSLQASSMRQALEKKENQAQGSDPTTPVAAPGFAHDRSASSASTRPSVETGGPQVNGKSISKPIESPVSRSMLDIPSAPPARSSSRPAPPGATSANDSFISPRAAPPPPPPAPPVQRHQTSESTSTMQSELSQQVSPNLPRYSAGVDFSMEEDMARILRGEDQQREPGVLRKMSNAVKHGRSFSDRAHSAASPSSKWSTKSPINGIDISSPTTAQSPDFKDDSAMLRNQLRRAQQRVAELEAEKNTLLHQSADLSEVSSQLQDKRNTMAVLNSQRELVVRELEIIMNHLQKQKDSDQPVNLKTLQTDILHDLNLSCQKLKDSLSKDIESLMKQKDDLTDEISKLIAMKDKGFQEYESLSTRNAQLTQHNNELIHGIQNFYKANRAPNGTSFDGGRPFPNGLGIQLHKDHSHEMRNVYGNETTMPGSMHDNEEASIISTPKVIDIRKPPKGNMLRKGTQGFLRGVRGAFNSEKDRSQDRGGYHTEGIPYNQMSETTLASKQSTDPARQKFGGLFGGSEKANSSKLSNLKQSHSNHSNPSLASDATAGAASLFGGDLTARCDLEKRVIPSIVARCIEEVELRGMDVEGIYRKSGGNSQVNQVKNGFEASNDHDISDIDLDIHAVTSALKQYFRRLPTPLIAYDVYDDLLDAVRQEDHEKKIIAMRECMDALPRSHRDCLEFLMFHLSRVMEKEKLNLVSSALQLLPFTSNIDPR
jgi:Rho-type GTPase-activating protein 1/2